jgi:pseudouridine synthase
MSDHLVKLLAERGVASRRASERLIREGRVSVDGKVVREPGERVDPGSQTVLFDGKPLPAKPTPVYLVLHKPKGTITSRTDPHERKTVFDLLDDPPASLAAVGRLDFQTEGVLLLTNDGELAYRLTHPSFGVTKTYLVKVSGTPEPRKLAQLQRGVRLDDGPTRPAIVELISSAGASSWLLIQIQEGRNRIVRRMIDHIGHKTLKLKRIGFGGITLRNLEPGQTRPLTAGELGRLRRLVRTQGKAKLEMTFDLRKAVAEALRQPIPKRERIAPSTLDEEGRPYRKKGWARPKPRKTRRLGSRVSGKRVGKKRR